MDRYTPHVYTHTNYTSGAEGRDLRCLGSEILSKAKVLPLDVPCWLFLVWQFTLEMAGKRFSQLDFSLQSSWGRETELSHDAHPPPKYGSSRRSVLPPLRSSILWGERGPGEGELGGPGWFWRLLGLHSTHLPKGIPSSPPPSFSFFLSLSPPPLCNSLPSPHVALSSLLLQNWPKVLLPDSKVVRIHGSPSPQAPSPLPWPWARGGFISSGQHSS